MCKCLLARFFLIKTFLFGKGVLEVLFCLRRRGQRPPVQPCSGLSEPRDKERRLEGLLSSWGDQGGGPAQPLAAFLSPLSAKGRPPPLTPTLVPPPGCPQRPVQNPAALLPSSPRSLRVQPGDADTAGPALLRHVTWMDTGPSAAHAPGNPLPAPNQAGAFGHPAWRPSCTCAEGSARGSASRWPVTHVRRARCASPGQQRAVEGRAPGAGAGPARGRPLGRGRRAGLSPRAAGRSVCCPDAAQSKGFVPSAPSRRVGRPTASRR